MAGTHLDTPYKYDLSPRQREVMELVAKGYTNAQIAEHVGISLDGAKYHVREILSKLDVSSREEAAERWREMQSPRSRLGRAWAGLFGTSGFPTAVAAAAGVAVIAAGAAVVVLAIGRSNDEGPLTAGNETTATAAASTVRSATITASADSPCDLSNASLDVALVPEGDDVLVRLSANVDAPCKLVGPATLALAGSGPALSSAVQPHANLERTFKVALDLPADGAFAEWRWMNWCDDRPAQGWTWRAAVGEVSQPGAQLEASRSANAFPACSTSSAPSIAITERFLVGVDGDVYPVPDCGQVAGWLCQFVSSLVVTGPDAFTRSMANGMPTTYRCTDGGLVEGAEYSTLCEGGGAGDIRDGYPLSRHGSEGGPVSPADLVPMLQTAAGSSAQAASVGGPTDGTTDWFIVAFRTGSSPAAVYLAFGLVPGREPALVGAGISGDNADTILGGGTTMTRMGETYFVPLPPGP